MEKKVLVIGGTYFAGRVFAMVAAKKGYELTFLNRGRYSMKALSETVQEIRADRTDVESLKACGLSGDFDVVVDFCAYEPGDILKILQALSCSTKQYVFLSSADVYKRMPGIKTEEAPLMEEMPVDPVNLYAYKKKLLEDELMTSAEAFGFSYTIIRPAFIYGPFNYAPRESVYIRSLLRGEPIYQPTDAAGKFQMVYVKDVAEAILACIEKDEAGNKAYNVSAPEVLDYEKFLALMVKVSGIVPRAIIPVTAEEVNQNNIPLPFPLTDYESELFDGQKICRELGVEYTDIQDGMQKTFNAFKPVYQQ